MVYILYMMHTKLVAEKVWREYLSIVEQLSDIQCAHEGNYVDSGNYLHCRKKQLLKHENTMHL